MLVTVFFIITEVIFFLAAQWFDANKIDHQVLLIANAVLFAVFSGSALFNLRSMQNKNPNVFVRSAMATSFLKLIILAGAAAVYILNAGESRSPYAIFVAMFLYIIYTVLEKKGLSKLQAKK